MNLAFCDDGDSPREQGLKSKLLYDHYNVYRAMLLISPDAVLSFNSDAQGIFTLDNSLGPFRV